MPTSSTATTVREAISELGAEAMGGRRGPADRLHLDFVRTARRHWRYLAVADSTGQRLTYGRLLIASFALGRVLERRTRGQKAVGTLLPASAGVAVTNLALHMAGRIPVNLNFTIGQDALAAAIAQAGITTILTSRRFLEKASLPAMPGMVFLEDVRGEISGWDKAMALVHARLTPYPLLARWFGGGQPTEGSPLATVVFSSGSTGVPKGIMLTHANILSNVDSLAQIFPMTTDDAFIGVLPFFHSFGLCGTFWFPLLQGAAVAYHPNPMDAKAVGELAEAHRATMLISTPTFCAGYMRRCTREQFAYLRYAIVGAEKLRAPIAQEFREKYGIDLLEGYGCTEMSPVIAVNRPNVEHAEGVRIGLKPGSVGHPIPGVAAKIVDQETGEDLGVNREGLLLVRGPNLMTGYLHAPERTAEVMRDGWYVTGDVARIDEDGFIFITDRLSRFSKIGGEMVPHVRVEDAINAVIGETCCAVTAVPDASRGERIIAFYVRSDVAPETLWEQLCQSSLPRLWLPKRDSLYVIEAIPTLGTGKTDLRRLRELALERAAAAGETAPTGAQGSRAS